jgi:hypothetical protein
MAGTPGTPAGVVTHQGLDAILRKQELAQHRVVAASLTVAFQIAKTDRLSRGETISDAMIKDEITKLYHDFLAVADPHIGLQMMQQAAQRRQP